MGKHDSSYRLFFTHVRMIRDLLVVILGERWVKLLDLDSAERVPSSFVSAAHKRRESDVIWKFRRKGSDEPVYVYLLLEFQSRPDHYMAVRLMTYIGLFFESLIASGQLPASGKLPMVIPLVIYNGAERWRPALQLADLIERLDPSAAKYVPRLRYRLIHQSQVPRELLAASESPVADLFWLDASPAWDQMLTGLSRLKQHVPPEEESLRRAFQVWLEEYIYPKLKIRPEDLPKGLTLEGMEIMLSERIDEWNRKLAEKNLKQGLKQGVKKGHQENLLLLLEEKFGGVDPRIRKRINQAKPDLLREWTVRFVKARTLAEVFGDQPAR